MKLNKRNKETILIGIGLVMLSLLLHYIHYLIFKDAHHTLIFLVADIAFIPMEVFFTTLVIDRLLENREKGHLYEKLNMLIGIFYTELGTKLLTAIIPGDNNVNNLHCDVVSDISKKERCFATLTENISNYEFSNIDISKLDIDLIRKLLDNNRELIITLVTNENLLDHSNFTEMLMSIVHLKEELNTRLSLDTEKYELEHIKRDIQITYKYLTIEWSKYMKYLSENYPMLFTKALINNPFDPRSKKEKDKLYLPK